MTTQTAIPDFLNELSRQISGDLRADTVTRTLYSTDASIYQVMPHAVLIPKTVDDVQAAVELAAKYQIPLLPRTAGSSLAGQAVNEALVIDFTRHLDNVLEVNAEEQWVRVQSGIVLDELNLHLRQFGLQFGPDPASSNRAALGGIVSNNSTGAHSILYGMTADHVLEMNVILNDGSMAHFAPLKPTELAQKLNGNGRAAQITRAIHQLAIDPAHQQTIQTDTPRHWRRCGGYNLDRFAPGAQGSGGAGETVSFQWPVDERFNLAKLVCGAEGTLAVMTEIKLNLVPVPKMTVLAIVHFDNLKTALTAVPVILETSPSAIELLDNLGLTLCRDVPEYARLLRTFIEGQPNCVLITEFYGTGASVLRYKIERLRQRLQKEKVGHIAITTALRPEQQANVWKVRKVGLGLLMSIKGDHKPIPFIEDAAVPVEHLADYVTQVENFCHDIGTDVAYYAHASAGCLHVRPLINAKKAAEVAKLPQITQFSVELLKGYGGSFSSEHGDGRARSWLNEAFFGPDLYALYRQVKHIFDPDNRLNPGNIVDAAPMTENLRYGENYQFRPLTPHLDFSEHASGTAGPTAAGGFDRAIEMCNGAGICRKRTMDTMCPSFQVTREEQHSTRGRANLLRAAYSGAGGWGPGAGEAPLPNPQSLTPTPQALFEAMDLCIECKACQAECPSSVDMAKIKFEFLAQVYDAHRIPLRARLFAAIPRLNRLGSGPLAPIANWTLRNRLIRAGMERFLGVSSQRTLPTFTRTPFTKQSHHASRITHHAPHPVALYVDPFTNHTEPDVLAAAAEVLAAAGFGVQAVDVGDDGRAAISKGVVQQARTAARRTVAKLAPFAKQGIPIVGVEPSSLLSLRDEYLYLLPGDEKAKLVAAHALTFEEFIAQQADAGTLNLTFRDEPRRILLHGHCHQKALVGTKPAQRTLGLLPNAVIKEVDSGCCGMAGSFGYEAEHVAISLQMGERRLFPAVRAAAPETIIVAAGTSCRHQIQEGVGNGRTALHPAQVLRDALIA